GEKREDVSHAGAGRAAEQRHAVGLFQAAQRSVLVAAVSGCPVGRADDQGQDLFGRRALVPGDDDPAAWRPGPPARGFDLIDQTLQKSVALGGRAVVHVVDDVWRDPYEG